MPETTRDERGRLVAGAPSLNPLGRPRRNPEVRLRSVFEEVLTRDELRELVRAHIERGKAGSVASTRLILEYAIGKPIERLQVESTARASLWAFIQEVRAAGDEPQPQPQVIEGAAPRAPDDEPDA